MFRRAVERRIEVSLMKYRFNPSKVLAFTIPTIVSVFLTGCGGKVQGKTYQDNGGVVKIEFKSGGKAYVSAGPATTTCTYSEDGNKVTMICEGDKTVFTVEDDGALSGPPDGLMTRLTKKD
jgi:hypothetical protein